MYQESLTNMLLEDSEYDNLSPSDENYMLYSPIPVGYSSISEQQYIFQNLIIGYDPEIFTILDIGAGRGDLFNFIKQLHNDKIISYKGLDHNKIMCNLAKEKYDIDCQFGAFETTELPKTEWVVANGVFTPRRCETEDADLRKLFEDIDILYEHATVALSFNLLNPINNTHHEGFFYVHPGLVLDMLIEKYQNVVLRNNYSKDVYTVTIYKI